MKRYPHQPFPPSQAAPPPAFVPRRSSPPVPDEQWRQQMAREVWLAKESHQVSLAGWAVGTIVGILALVLVGMFGYAGLLWLRELVGF